MRDILTLTAADILAIPRDQPEKLFTGEAAQAKTEYRKLVSQWHADHNPDPDAHDVMAHVNVLYELAAFRLAADEWITPNVVVFKSTDGRFELKYKSHRNFELGDVYVGDRLVAYSIFKDNEDLFKNAKRTIENLRYADDKMKTDVGKLMPTIFKTLETPDRLVMLVRKNPDQLLLSDVLDHYKGKIPSKHVAWMISRLYNATCYFGYLGIMHAGFTPDACFISPEHHSVSILGGWWYATPLKQRLTALPGLAAEFSPDDVLDAQVADEKIDLTLVKTVGRMLLGDADGSRLLMSKDVPVQLSTYLRGWSGRDAVVEFKYWREDVLVNAFGPRRFVELKLTADDLYGEK